VEDLSPYPGFGAARRDDTTTNKHCTSTQHLLPTPHVRYMGNTCGGDIDVSTGNHNAQTTVQYQPFILINVKILLKMWSLLCYFIFLGKYSEKPCAFRNILNTMEIYQIPSSEDMHGNAY